MDGVRPQRTKAGSAEESRPYSEVGTNTPVHLYNLSTRSRQNKRVHGSMGWIYFVSQQCMSKMTDLWVSGVGWVAITEEGWGSTLWSGQLVLEKCQNRSRGGFG